MHLQERAKPDTESQFLSLSNERSYNVESKDAMHSLNSSLRCESQNLTSQNYRATAEIFLQTKLFIDSDGVKLHGIEL